MFAGPPLFTRRDFIKTSGAALATVGALSSFIETSAASEAPEIPKALDGKGPHYRAVSWWLTWDDLTWPNAELIEKIRRRADRCAENGVNCCVIFGAHFRWDFMPLWDRLHDELSFIAGELHERKILVFDHHSSVLTHRPRNREEALKIWEQNRHHVPFYPSREEAAVRRFNGSLVNDWRMLDVESGAPVYLTTYCAEQYCMNHSGFREAYRVYLEKLKKETAIDGLMSDDGIFYAGWRACACEHCRKRFETDYGHRLPKVSDTTFWGNRHSEAFRDWIAMRFRSSSDFLIGTKQVFPPGFPLLTCCSSSDGSYLPALGMSYQDFILNCNHVLLEMVGSTPSLAGTWDDRIPSQLLHLGIARDHQVPCFGLGYGFFPDTAFFVWAVNKFLGSDCWLSTLKGRLDATPAELAALADDSELVGECYRWEKEHPQLFTGQVDTDIAVFFSRCTRDYYGQSAADYTNDYATTCLSLMRGGISCEVVTEIPRFAKTRCLLSSSVICLSAAEKQALEKFLNDGGSVVITGPTGHFDERANPLRKPWLENFGVNVEFNDPARSGAFPPYSNLHPPVEIARCQASVALRQNMPDGWLTVPIGKGQLLWRPERISQPGVGDAVVKQLQRRQSLAARVDGLPAEWRLRQYREKNRLLIHALPGKVETVTHAALKNHLSNERIVETINYKPLAGNLVLESSATLRKVTLHSPDLKEARQAAPAGGDKWSANLDGVSRYFILECVI